MATTRNQFFLVVESVNKKIRYSIGERLPGDRITIVAKCPNEFSAKQLIARLQESTKVTG